MFAAQPIQTTAGLEAPFEIATYYPIFIYLVVILAFAVGSLVASQFLFLKPKNNTAVKLMPYESGVDPIGSARMQFDVKFYLIAILFLVFDVELLFLYPWAVTAYSAPAGDPVRAAFGRMVFWEIILFIFSLGIAYIYAWRKGVFQWR